MDVIQKTEGEKPKTHFAIKTLKGHKADVIAEVTASDLPEEYKAAVIFSIGRLLPEMDLVRLNFNAHPLRRGSNVTWTVVDL